MLCVHSIFTHLTTLLSSLTFFPYTTLFRSALQKRIWQLSLFSFLVAAFTGFLYRYGLFYPLPGDLGFANIRHAHSHLMFFNWITPPLLSWMVAALGDGEKIGRASCRVGVVVCAGSQGEAEDRDQQ